MRRKTYSLNLSSIKVCSDCRLTPEQRVRSLQVARAERADNLMPGFAPGPHGPQLAMAMAAIPKPKMALLVAKLWKPGRTLHVRFLETPSARVRERIEHYAHEWEQYANIVFKFVNSGKAEVRISLNPALGSWSYLGTDALLIAANKATMNFGWFDDTTPDDEFSRTVLHEFGHAIGAIHEHVHPDNGIEWNKTAVYAYYAKTQGWSKQEVDEQIFLGYALTQLNSSSYDAKSIMHYAIPAGLLKPGATPVDWNRRLSVTDKKFIAKQYP
jgi:serralysin